MKTIKVKAYSLIKNRDGSTVYKQKSYFPWGLGKGEILINGYQSMDRVMPQKVIKYFPKVYINISLEKTDDIRNIRFDLIDEENKVNGGINLTLNDVKTLAELSRQNHSQQVDEYTFSGPNFKFISESWTYGISLVIDSIDAIYQFEAKKLEDLYAKLKID